MRSNKKLLKIKHESIHYKTIRKQKCTPKIKQNKNRIQQHSIIYYIRLKRNIFVFELPASKIWHCYCDHCTYEKKKNKEKCIS